MKQTTIKTLVMTFDDGVDLVSFMFKNDVFEGTPYTKNTLGKAFIEQLYHNVLLPLWGKGLVLETNGYHQIKKLKTIDAIEIPFPIIREKIKTIQTEIKITLNA